jgi:hypothetical protein
MQPTQIVFPAALEGTQFATQKVELDATFPLLSIVLIDSAKGTHEFKIDKMLPHQHPSVLESAVAEAKLQIEHFWTVLAFVCDAIIRPTGDVFYEFNGQRHQFNRKRSGSSANGAGVAGAGWFDNNRSQLLAHYDLDRVKQLNFACSVPEPIGRFIALYSLLLTIANDRQSEVDKLILRIEPTTHQTLSPKTGQLESLYTRLRNELAHARQTTTLFSTHEEIQLHLKRFEWVVKSIVRPTVQLRLPPLSS